ncbi:MAG: hypothetical protein WCO98_08335 [bacterium]
MSCQRIGLAPEKPHCAPRCPPEETRETSSSNDEKRDRYHECEYDNQCVECGVGQENRPTGRHRWTIRGPPVPGGTTSRPKRSRLNPASPTAPAAITSRSYLAGR